MRVHKRLPHRWMLSSGFSAFCGIWVILVDALRASPPGKSMWVSKPRDPATAACISGTQSRGKPPCLPLCKSLCNAPMEWWVKKFLQVERGLYNSLTCLHEGKLTCQKKRARQLANWQASWLAPTLKPPYNVIQRILIQDSFKLRGGQFYLISRQIFVSKRTWLS